MKNLQYKVILLRHAESEKNIKKIHGGQGEELTESGILQAQNAGKMIRSIISDEAVKLFVSNSIHTQYTASHMSEILNIPVEKPIYFTPLNLGIADGLSEEALMNIDFNSYLLFKQWRNREIDIKDLKIPGMESYIDFWNRGLNLLANIKYSGHSIMVCSNSLMILLYHIMMNNHPVETNNYRHISIPNCGIICFKTNDYVDFYFDSITTTVDIPK